MSTKQWPTRPLGKCAKFLSGGTPRKAREEFWEGDIPWVSSGEMAQSRIYDTPLHITSEAAVNGSRLVPANTVLAVVRGMSLAKEFRVAITQREVAFNQDLKAFSCEPDVDPQFLFYAMLARQEHIRKLATEASHGTKKLETDVLSAFEILVPKVEVQHRAVKLPCAYDNLIENNRRRIALLEESTRILYREWFAYLRFPGHEHVKVTHGVPKGWEKKTLGGKIILNYGKALKAENRVEGTIPVYGSSGIIGTHEKALVKGPGVVVGRKGNVGSVYWSDSDFYPIDTVYYIDSESCSFHLYHALQNMQFISNDAAVPGLNRDFAYSRPYLEPAPLIATLFEETVAPIYKQIFKLKTYNDKLKHARDLLLPRLMNGQIAV